MSYLVSLSTLKGHGKSSNQDTDLRAASRMELELKIFRTNRLGIPQDRIEGRLDALQRTISNHLAKMPELAYLLNTDLSRGFTVVKTCLYQRRLAGFPEYTRR